MIELKKPQNGETVELMTEVQINFIESDRTKGTAADFNYLDLKKGDSDNSIPKSVSFEWEAEGEAVVQISEDADFKDFYESCGNNSCEVYNLKCAARYYWRVVCNNEISEVLSFNTNERCPRFLRVDGITNVRDCGGWMTASGKRIKQGLLFRGSEMNSHVNITEEGLKTMRDELKIKYVIDFRSTVDEIVEDVYGRGYINISVLPYCDWFKQPNSIMKTIFEILADEKNYPVYYHCWGGADRTGTLTFILGALLGQDLEDLIDDYEITSLSIWGDRSRNIERFGKFIDAFYKYDGETLSEKAQNYLLSCGVSKDMINNFKKIMLL